MIYDLLSERMICYLMLVRDAIGDRFNELLENDATAVRSVSLLSCGVCIPS